ncbi:MAG: amino acid adenylation domain-containing protein [Cellvibrionaceae bacterium]|nr:amino acid adenylation domain-containing protein [Cellvibrionaceae bacterium]
MVKSIHNVTENESTTSTLDHFNGDFDATVSGLIAQRMLTHPERAAIIDGETTITYKQLMKRANAVAAELSNRGVEPGSLVGVCMLRSWDLIAALLGAMQAGCAYVPLDPAYPQERVRYMLEHSRAVAAIVDNECAAELCKDVREQVWMTTLSDHTQELQARHASANHLAYVIYTSGSTGQPKGVAVEHKSVVAMCQSMAALFSDEELSGVFAGASVCFDTSVMEILGTLSLGGCVILAKNALELTELPEVARVKTCVMVASALQAVLAKKNLPESIQCLVFGGEALKRSLVEQVHELRPSLRILNAYGPTEDTVYSTIAEIPRGTQVITIGRSVANSRAYILNEDLQPVAKGVAGELYLAGSKLARGYLFDEAKTQERFLEIKPSKLIPDTRLYKTGDLCSWTNNQEIEFLGRIDQQVKIRGFRIELEEIESTLELMPGVEVAAAAAVDGGIGQKILVAYIVSQNEAVTEASVKWYLSQRLPKYMVPQVVKHLAELPFLPNDKLDRKKLMCLEKETLAQQKTTAKRAIYPANSLAQHTTPVNNPQQAATVTIVTMIQAELASLLSIADPEQISPDDSFESLGLDSLTSLEFSGRISALIGRELPASAITQQPTANALASFIVHRLIETNATPSADTLPKVAKNTLANFQVSIQSSHPTFQAASATAWCANDKSKLVQAFMGMVNNNRRNPYGKVLQTGSAARGVVSDPYHNNEQREAIIWSTNLYFGLNRHPQVIEEAANALTRFGTGMGISAAATGMTQQHLAFEQEFADLVGKPSACLFPTGYTANLGAISGLLKENDIVVIDQLCHASIVDGARLSGATIRTFKHNSASDLASVLESVVSPYCTTLVVLESVYSMGEGAAPVADIARTAKKYNALVLVDEAHSFGFYGEAGAGICAAQGVTEDVDFIMTTLSKALGSIGGVIAGSAEHIGLLKSSSRAYIFQASISPADIAAALASLRRLRADNALREQLWDITRYMRRRFEEEGYDLGTGDGPIVTPHFGDKEKLYAIVEHLYQRGIQTLAVTYPIVEIGRGRLRLICSASHTREDVEKTLAALFEAEREADQQLAALRAEIPRSNIAYADLDDWARGFTDYLITFMAKVAAPMPNLAICVGLLGEPEVMTILCKDRKVTLSTHKEADMPVCSLLFKEQAALAALQSSDAEGLLNSICQGTCQLNGQVEAFIWFIARIVDRQRQSASTLTGA